MAQTSPIRLVLLLLLALPVAAQFETSAVIQYTAERVLLGFTPTAMNNRGWIVGYTNWPVRPMRYRPGVGSEQISDEEGRLYDINDAGTAVGYLRLNGRAEAIVRPAGAPWQRLGTFGGESIAYALNESGQIVGDSSEDLGRGFRAFIYTEAEGMKMLSPDRFDRARGINEAGQVVGEIVGNCMWDPVLGRIDLGPAQGIDREFYIVGISDNGIIAAKYASRKLATFSLTEGLRLIGDDYIGNGAMFPTAINSRAWIVGHRLDRAFLYVRGDGMRNLDTLLVAPLGKPLINTVDINDRDDILARAEGGRYYILKRVR